MASIELIAAPAGGGEVDASHDGERLSLAGVRVHGVVQADHAGLAQALALRS